MPRFAPLLLLMASACDPAVALVGDSDWNSGIEDPWPEDTGPDLSAWEGARLEIIEPQAGAALELDAPATFSARIVDLQGNPLPVDNIQWTTDRDDLWLVTQAAFEDDRLGPGDHVIRVETVLPTGDTLVTSVGGIHVQSRYTGTYAGFFSVDVGWQGVTATCNGASILLCDETGEIIDGDGDCQVSILSFDLPLRFVFEFDNNEGAVDGKAGADIFGWFTYDFGAKGTLKPFADGLQVTWSGNALGIVDIDASLEAERVSTEIPD